MISRSYLKKINGKIPVISVSVYSSYDSVFFKFYIQKDIRKIPLVSIRAQQTDCDISRGKNSFETHCESMALKYKGHNLGTYCYSYVIDWIMNTFTNAKISSSDDPSDEARRVWESNLLNRFYEIKKSGYGYIVRDKKSLTTKKKPARRKL